MRSTGHSCAISASWQTEQSVRDEQSGLSAEDAIAWGRERAERVLIRLGVGDYYWAGVGRRRRTRHRGDHRASGA
jgi:hypothetical protein